MVCPLAKDPTPFCQWAVSDSDRKPELVLQLKETIKPEITPWNLPDLKKWPLFFWLAPSGMAVPCIILPISRFFKETEEQRLKTPVALAVPYANTGARSKRQLRNRLGSPRWTNEAQRWKKVPNHKILYRVLNPSEMVTGSKLNCWRREILSQESIRNYFSLA